MEELLSRCPRWALPARGRPALCAVSGGLDSMCLLDLLDRWCRERQGRIVAAHFNHHLRGAESDRDEAFVRDWCAGRDIPFVSGSGDVRGLAEREGLSLEEAARTLRYAFLRREAEKLGQHIRIYTAHHADDNAETILFNLIRGTGAAGLTGMAYQQNGIYRPLLDVTRAELAAYAADHHIPHVEDATNADPDSAARNFLRLEVMPRLKQINPQAVAHINGAGRRLRTVDRSLEEEAARRTACVEVQEGRVTLSKQALAEAPDAVKPRMLLRLFDLLGVGRRDITAAHLNAILHPGDPPPAFDRGPAAAGLPRHLGGLPPDPAGPTGGGGPGHPALAAGGADGPDRRSRGAGGPAGSAGDPRRRPQRQAAVPGPPDLPHGAGPAAGHLRRGVSRRRVAAGGGRSVFRIGGRALPVYSDRRSGKGERS